MGSLPSVQTATRVRGLGNGLDGRGGLHGRILPIGGFGLPSIPVWLLLLPCVSHRVGGSGTLRPWRQAREIFAQLSHQRGRNEPGGRQKSSRHWPSCQRTSRSSTGTNIGRRAPLGRFPSRLEVLSASWPVASWPVAPRSAVPRPAVPHPVPSQPAACRISCSRAAAPNFEIDMLGPNKGPMTIPAGPKAGSPPSAQVVSR